MLGGNATYNKLITCYADWCADQNECNKFFSPFSFSFSLRVMCQQVIAILPIRQARQILKMQILRVMIQMRRQVLVIQQPIHPKELWNLLKRHYQRLMHGRYVFFSFSLKYHFGYHLYFVGDLSFRLKDEDRKKSNSSRKPNTFVNEYFI